MRKSLSFLLFAALMSGCCSYTDIGHIKNPCGTDDGETPVATITVMNVAYSLFGVLPIESGTTWKEGPYAENHDSWNATWFENRCTLDETLASVRAALKEVGSNRIMNLVTDADSWRFWSLYIIKREVMKTSCTVLKPLPPPAAK